MFGAHLESNASSLLANPKFVAMLTVLTNCQPHSTTLTPLFGFVNLAANGKDVRARKFSSEPPSDPLRLNGSDGSYPESCLRIENKSWAIVFM
jgi:hypothetical protein